MPLNFASLHIVHNTDHGYATVISSSNEYDACEVMNDEVKDSYSLQDTEDSAKFPVKTKPADRKLKVHKELSSKVVRSQLLYLPRKI